MCDIVFSTKERGFSYESKTKKRTVVTYSPLTDVMHAYIVSGDKHSTKKQEVPRARVFITPSDTSVVNSIDSAKDKDLVCDSCDCYAGYTRLIPVEPWRWPKVLDKENYLKQMDFIEPRNLMHEEIESKITIAFKCEWPVAAKEWIERPRKFGWPPKHVIADIQLHGCNVIPQSHPFSDNSDIEWHYSFYKAEKMLAEDALSDSQLDCFHIIKLILDFIFKDRKISLVILKQVFFYTCEELDVNLWNCDTLSCIHMFLDRLLMSFRYRNVKGYFLAKENFLDDELDDEVLDECIKKIEVLKHHTFPLLYFTFDEYIHVFSYMNVLFDRLIEDVLVNPSINDYNATVHNCFLSLVASGISDLWIRKRFPNAFYLCKRAVNQLNSIRFTMHQLSLQDIVQHVIKTLPTLLNKWMFAFFADLELQTRYVDIVCEEHSAASISDFFSPKLEEYVRERHGSVAIPIDLTHEANLGYTSVAFLTMLDTIVPRDVYCNVLTHCMAHVEQILKRVPSASIEEQDNMLYDVKTLIHKIRAGMLQVNKKRIVENLLNIAEIQKSLGNMMQYESALTEAKDILKTLDVTD